MLTRPSLSRSAAVHAPLRQPSTATSRASTVGPLTSRTSAPRTGSLNPSLVPASAEQWNSFVPRGWQALAAEQGTLSKAPYAEVTALTVGKDNARALIVVGKTRDGFERLGVAPNAVQPPNGRGRSNGFRNVFFSDGKLLVTHTGGERHQRSNTYVIDATSAGARGSSRLQVESVALRVVDASSPGLTGKTAKYNLLDGTVENYALTRTSMKLESTKRHAFKAADFSAIDIDARVP